MLLILFPIFIICVTLWIWVNYQTPEHFPPGPPGWLSIRSLISKDEPYFSKVMIKLSEKFGPVVGLRTVKTWFICVSGYEAVKDVLNNPHLSGRPDSFVFNLKTSGLRRGVLMTDGDLWKEQRRFTMFHLKELGFGKSSLEVVMLEEASNLIAEFEATIDCSPDGNVMLDDPFTMAVVSVLWAVIAGERFQHNDPKAKEMIASVTGFSRANNGGPTIMTLFPIFRFIAPEWTGFNELNGHIHKLRSAIEEVVRQHRETRQPGCNRDFLDAYLDTLDADDASTVDTTFSEEQMIGIFIDIFIAGAETTSYTLGFALLYMMDNPDVQAKVQMEIDQVLQGRQPSITDRTSLPYTDATLQEIHRRATVAPVTVPHVAMEDTTCQGYYIPKNTVSFVNLWSVHMDPKVWPEPYKFLPERHIDQEGNVIKSDHIMTFGLGKRSCMGEALARSSVFLFFVSMMQHFQFSKIANTPFSLEPIVGLTYAPQPCLAKVTKRSLS